MGRLVIILIAKVFYKKIRRLIPIIAIILIRMALYY
jgi:hypothetical protein